MAPKTVVPRTLKDLNPCLRLQRRFLDMNIASLSTWHAHIFPVEHSSGNATAVKICVEPLQRNRQLRKKRTWRGIRISWRSWLCRARIPWWAVPVNQAAGCRRWSCTSSSPSASEISLCTEHWQPILGALRSGIYTQFCFWGGVSNWLFPPFPSFLSPVVPSLHLALLSSLPQSSPLK